MRVVRAGAEPAPRTRRSGTFTGEVWLEPVLAVDGLTVGSVVFTPGARTFWHSHEAGQLLTVTGGRGWVVARGESAERVERGDIVWAPPGEVHWHGAADDAHLAHTAVSLGTTTWLEEVTARDLAALPGPEGDARPAAATGDRYAEGLRVRREVMGSEFVARALDGASEFTRPVQELVTEVAWGSVWARPGLDRRTRSLLVLGMLAALGRSTELAGHVRGALTNGATEREVQEALLATVAYCGAPAALEAFRVADRVLADLRDAPP